MIIIGVKTGDDKLSAALVRRMAELAPGHNFISEPEKECSVDFMISEEGLESLLPVSALIDRIDGLHGRSGGSLRTYLIRSDIGGGGCTAIALTAARIIAGRSGAKTALISLDDTTGNFIYAEGMNGSRNIKELGYLMHCGRTVNPEKYMIRDRFGVDIFVAGKEIDHSKLTELLREAGYDAVITDGGKNGRKLQGQVVVNVASCQDARCTGFEELAKEEELNGGREFFVINRASYRSSEGRIFKVPEDRSSFRKNKAGGCEIAMDRAFAAAVGELISEAERELDDGHSDFYK